MDTPIEVEQVWAYCLTCVGFVMMCVAIHEARAARAKDKP